MACGPRQAAWRNLTIVHTDEARRSCCIGNGVDVTRTKASTRYAPSWNALRFVRLSGFLVNSHTDNLYLDDPRFWPILEAAEALDAPLYIHPRAPSDGMAAPFRDYRMEGSIWGYGMETGTHAVRLMLSGVLDRFPRLRIVLGHMGEALPFWLWRLDYMAAPGSRAALKNALASQDAPNGLGAPR